MNSSKKVKDHRGSTITPSFIEAQQLFSKYSTLKTNVDLYNGLHDILSQDEINSYSMSNPREIYNDVVLKYYSNEIAIKSCFINNVLLKTDGHVTIFELSVGGSRADLCKINGTSIAYEIKTDLDNLQRLDKQLRDYMQIFEKVFVICSSTKVSQIREHLIPECGIYSYSISKNGIYRFKMEKVALASDRLDPSKQLSVLTKKEIITHFQMGTSQSKNEMIVRIESSVSNSRINSVFKNCMKLKYQKQWEFLKDNHQRIFEIDYQWFFKNTIDPSIIYSSELHL